eukprot:PhF_6_TR34996/c2_g1_i1/m.50868
MPRGIGKRLSEKEGNQLVVEYFAVFGMKVGRCATAFNVTPRTVRKWVDTCPQSSALYEFVTKHPLPQEKLKSGKVFVRDDIPPEIDPRIHNVGRHKKKKEKNNEETSAVSSSSSSDQGDSEEDTDEEEEEEPLILGQRQPSVLPTPPQQSTPQQQQQQQPEQNQSDGRKKKRPRKPGGEYWTCPLCASSIRLGDSSLSRSGAVKKHVTDLHLNQDIHNANFIDNLRRSRDPPLLPDISEEDLNKLDESLAPLNYFILRRCMSMVNFRLTRDHLKSCRRCRIVYEMTQTENWKRRAAAFQEHEHEKRVREEQRVIDFFVFARQRVQGGRGSQGEGGSGDAIDSVSRAKLEEMVRSSGVLPPRRTAARPPSPPPQPPPQPPPASPSPSTLLFSDHRPWAVMTPPTPAPVSQKVTTTKTIPKQHLKLRKSGRRSGLEKPEFKSKDQNDYYAKSGGGQTFDSDDDNDDDDDFPQPQPPPPMPQRHSSTQQDNIMYVPQRVDHVKPSQEEKVMARSPPRGEPPRFVPPKQTTTRQLEITDATDEHEHRRQKLRHQNIPITDAQPLDVFSTFDSSSFDAMSATNAALSQHHQDTPPFHMTPQIWSQFTNDENFDPFGPPQRRATNTNTTTPQKEAVSAVFPPTSDDDDDDD